MPNVDPICQEIHRLLQPWTNGTISLYGRITQPKPVRGAHLCAKKYEHVEYYTNLLGDTFTRNPTHFIHLVTTLECVDFFKYKTCSEGTMTRKSKYMYTTNKALELKFPVRIEGFFKGAQPSETTNCILEEIQVAYHPNTLELESPIYDLSHCNHASGSYEVQNMTLIWAVDCNFGKSKQGSWEGSYRKSTFWSHDKQVDLTFNANPPTLMSCEGTPLKISHQGWGIRAEDFSRMSRSQNNLRSKRESATTEELATELTLFGIKISQADRKSI